MSTVAIPDSLVPLVNFLDNLQARVPIDGLRQHLTSLEVTLDDLKAFVCYNDTCYSRNLICQNTWYELLCICWKNGQESLIHNHAESTCGLRIIEGEAVETTFEAVDGKRVRAVSNCTLQNGQVCCTQDADIHQISNLQSNGADLVTLHIYSPPLRTMQTWEKE